jgi:hypothetical protein
MTTAVCGKAPTSERAQHSPSPRLRGEGWDEGRELVETWAYAAAPHPSPLPVRTGRGDMAAFRDALCINRHSAEDFVR